jgi:hypothetical protein
MCIIYKSVDDFVNNVLLTVSLLNTFLITFNWNMVLKISETYFLLLYMSNNILK